MIFKTKHCTHVLGEQPITVLLERPEGERVDGVRLGIGHADDVVLGDLVATPHLDNAVDPADPERAIVLTVQDSGRVHGDQDGSARGGLADERLAVVAPPDGHLVRLVLVLAHHPRQRHLGVRARLYLEDHVLPRAHGVPHATEGGGRDRLLLHRDAC